MESVREKKGSDKRPYGQKHEIGKQSIFFRSKWDVMYAKYLQFLVDENKIKDWEYKPEVIKYKNTLHKEKVCKFTFMLTNMNGSKTYILVDVGARLIDIDVKECKKFFPESWFQYVGREDFMELKGAMIEKEIWIE